MVLRDRYFFFFLRRAWPSEQSGTATNNLKLLQSWRIREEQKEKGKGFGEMSALCVKAPEQEAES